MSLLTTPHSTMNLAQNTTAYPALVRLWEQDGAAICSGDILRSKRMKTIA